jgi:hypothetical protein
MNGTEYLIVHVSHALSCAIHTYCI